MTWEEYLKNILEILKTCLLKKGHKETTNGLMTTSGAFNLQIPGELFEVMILNPGEIFESMFQIPGEIFRSEARGIWALV